MTDDLRALAKRCRGHGTGWVTEDDMDNLCEAVLTLLSEKGILTDELGVLARANEGLTRQLEAREVELRMLKRSNTVLNERLEAAEQEVGVVRRESKMHYEWYLGACGARDVSHAALAAAERRLINWQRVAYERTADWNRTLGRAEQAEAALKMLMKTVWYIVGSNPAGWTDDEVANPELLCALRSLKATYLTLEGREGKP